MLFILQADSWLSGFAAFSCAELRPRDAHALIADAASPLSAMIADFLSPLAMAPRRRRSADAAAAAAASD